MSEFKSALVTWFDQHPDYSLRHVAEAASLTVSDLSRIRKGQRTITFDTLCKLLPAVEKLTTRPETLGLLIAYLRDETPSKYQSAIAIKVRDEGTGADARDWITRTRDRWDSRARSEPEFAKMWLQLDGYMHEPDAEEVDRNIAEFLPPETDELRAAESATSYTS